MHASFWLLSFSTIARIKKKNANRKWHRPDHDMRGDVKKKQNEKEKKKGSKLGQANYRTRKEKDKKRTSMFVRTHVGGAGALLSWNTICHNFFFLSLSSFYGGGFLTCVIGWFAQWWMHMDRGRSVFSCRPPRSLSLFLSFSFSNHPAVIPLARYTIFPVFLCFFFFRFLPICVKKLWASSVVSSDSFSQTCGRGPRRVDRRRWWSRERLRHFR